MDETRLIPYSLFLNLLLFLAVVLVYGFIFKKPNESIGNGISNGCRCSSGTLIIVFIFLYVLYLYWPAYTKWRKEVERQQEENTTSFLDQTNYAPVIKTSNTTLNKQHFQLSNTYESSSINFKELVLYNSTSVDERRRLT